ncbi:MAG: hypothetical protein AB9903_07655 [Vulcanimicrobiota bacterium]
MSDSLEIDSNEYWQGSDELIAQKFYITLCQLISGSLDYALGCYLRDREILSWSVTASYYSMVHFARMIIFIAKGDFPKGHDLIGNFFSADGNFLNKKKKPIQRWLSGFLKQIEKQRTKREEEQREVKIDESQPYTFDNMCMFYNNDYDINGFSSELTKLGKIFNQARTLRNDSNYEPLLIAHEYRHDTISEDFKELAECMSLGAKQIFKTGIKAFIHYLKYDRSLDGKREIFKCFVYKYLKFRIYIQIESRVKDKKYRDEVKELFTLLQDYVSSYSNVDSNSIEEIDTAVSMEIFNEKTELMQGFQEKIGCLKSTIGNEKLP